MRKLGPAKKISLSTSYFHAISRIFYVLAYCSVTLWSRCECESKQLLVMASCCTSYCNDSIEHRTNGFILKELKARYPFCCPFCLAVGYIMDVSLVRVNAWSSRHFSVLSFSLSTEMLNCMVEKKKKNPADRLVKRLLRQFRTIIHTIIMLYHRRK